MTDQTNTTTEEVTTPTAPAADVATVVAPTEETTTVEVAPEEVAAPVAEVTPEAAA